MRSLRNFPTTIFCVALCFGAVVLTPNPAPAALIDQGVTTLDDVTNLEWLDLTETIGQSYDSVDAGFGGFTTAQGFGFATESDILTLFAAAGGTIETSPTSSNVVPVQTLFSLLGFGFGGSTREPFGRGWADFDIFSPTMVESPFYQLTLGTPFDLSTAILGRFFPVTDPFLKNTGVTLIGSFLIRTAVAPVPLPAALPLFGSALAMLGIVGWRRKRRAAA